VDDHLEGAEPVERPGLAVHVHAEAEAADRLDMPLDVDACVGVRVAHQEQRLVVATEEPHVVEGIPGGDVAEMGQQAVGQDRAAVGPVGREEQAPDPGLHELCGPDVVLAEERTLDREHTGALGYKRGGEA
jgi:hypothetical protein